MRAFVLACAALLLTTSCAASGTGTAVVSPASSPAATPHDYGAPPPRISLFYVRDPWHPGWLTGYDWSGQPRATIKLTADPGFISAAPDGSAFLRADGTYLGRLGDPIASPPAPEQKGLTPGLWTDDGALLCFVEQDPKTFAWTLSWQVPGKAVHEVAVIVRDQGVGQTGIVSAACNWRDDFAILVRYSIWWPREVWVVQLSTGKVRNHQTYAPNAYATLVASPDGAYLAESSSNSMAVSQWGALSTTIRRVKDWSVVGHMPSGFQVLAFSGDDSMALISTSPLSVPGVHLAAMEIPSGRERWRYDGVEVLYRWTSRPRAPGFALALRGPLMLNRIVIAGPEGPTASVPGALEPLF